MDQPLKGENELPGGQMRVLEMVASGAPVWKTLDQLVTFIEAQEDGLTCGILVVAGGGQHFRRGSGPHLPASYHQALDGAPITPPYLGPCGEAAHLGASVVVPDIAGDERWAPEWRELVLSCGFRSCLSTPVRATDGRVLASFAMYHNEQRDPHPKRPEIVGIATHLASIALERHEESEHRNRIEHELRESERRLRELLEALPAAIYTTDTEGRITFYNETAAELWGTRPDLSSEKSRWCGSWKIYLPDGRPLPIEKCPMAVAIRERRPVRNVEIVVERPDGTRRSAMPFPTPLFDGAGRFTGAVNMLVDLTDMKRMEESVFRRVHEQAALYRLTDRLYRAGPLADGYEAAIDTIVATLRCNRASVLLFDEEGVMRFVAWRGLSDRYRQAVEGHSPWRSGDTNPHPIFVEDIETADEPEQLKAVIRKEGIRALAFIPLVVNDAVIGKFMTYHEAPHSFSKEEVDLAMNIARQLGFSIERKRAEEARRAVETELRENEERLRRILDSAKEYAIITLDSAGRIRSWNEGAKRLLGFDDLEVLGQPGAIFFSQQDKEAGVPEQELASARENGRAANERWHIRKDGSRFWGSGVMLPLDHHGRNAYLKIFRDQTEERLAEEQQKLLINELNHRVKNTLATVQSLTAQTLRGAAVEREIRTALDARLSALARSHDILTQERWEGAWLRDVVERSIEPFGGENGDVERFVVEGEDVRLAPKAALSLGLALHELATNASKYGALSAPGGRVLIEWRSKPGEREDQVKFVWQERGGPPVLPPRRKGFGTRLIEKALAYELRGQVKLDYAPEGIRFEVLLPQHRENSP